MSLTPGHLRHTGRAPKTPIILGVRELAVEEVQEVLSTERGVAATPLQRLSFRHHHLARLVAAGKSLAECSAKTGLSYSRISILKSDSTFRDLVAFHKAEADAHHSGYQENLAALAGEAVSELMERFEDEDRRADFTNGELLAITKVTSDRIGFGPSAKQEHTVNINFGDRLDEARRRARLALEDRVLDITPEIVEAAE